MQQYTMRDVERVLQLRRSALQGLVRLGFVQPGRGPRRQYLFSFQDLIILRAARALMQANIPRRRISRSLGQLRERLPEAVPLSGLAICAIGDRVVVREGVNHYQADDGQYLLGLDVSIQGGTLRVMERRQGKAAAALAAATRASGPVNTNSAEVALGARGADEWFAEALRLEDTDPIAAIEAYALAAQTDPVNAAAWTNWGRLLQERGDARAAEKVYRRALERCGADSLLFFNLGVALEDLDDRDGALSAYHAALSEDPGFADCHYNLARLYELAGKTQHAIRHLGQYRRLVTRSER